MKHYTVR